MQTRTRNKLIMASIIAPPLVAIASAFALINDPSDDQSDIKAEINIVDPTETTAEIETEDPRQVFDSQLGGQYESVVYLSHNGKRCTATDLGNGIAVSAAHCFSDKMIFERVQKLGGNSYPDSVLAFGCEQKGDDMYCNFGVNITEVAIPKAYGVAPNLTGTAWESKRGSDVAFIRYAFNESLPLPEQSFDLKVGINPEEQITQMGYSSDRAGLTGGNCDAIETTGKNSDYIFSTNCYVAPQDSGSPVFNQLNEIVGISSASNVDVTDPEQRVLQVTPITEAFLSALEEFSNGELRGENINLQNGTSAILFDYEISSVVYEPR